MHFSQAVFSCIFLSSVTALNPGTALHRGERRWRRDGGTAGGFAHCSARSSPDVCQLLKQGHTKKVAEQPAGRLLPIQPRSAQAAVRC